MSTDETYAPQVKGDDDVTPATSMSKELSFINIHSIERPVLE